MTAMAVAVVMLVGTAVPAAAADNTERHQQCDMTAHQVTKNNGYATASGTVFCDSNRFITLKVILQFMAADGKWYESKATSTTVRDGATAYHSTSYNCSRAERPYRTRIEVTIDGGQVWEVNSVSPTPSARRSDPSPTRRRPARPIARRAGRRRQGARRLGPASRRQRADLRTVTD
jgi:hypothetical protein